MKVQAQKISWYLFVLFSIQVVSAKIPLCISLGGACAPALNLRALNLRTEAYPFDWTVSPFDALYKALQDNFKHFLDNVTLRPDRQGVIDHYGIHFTHDWPTTHKPNIDALNVDFVGNCPLTADWYKALPAVKEKYSRRIARFQAACTGTEKVYFIRSDGISREEAVALKDFFKHKYPTLNFVILAFGGLNCQEPWNIENIQNFYVPHYNDTPHWAATLREIGPEFDFVRRISLDGLTNFEELLECIYCLREREENTKKLEK